MFLTFRGPSGGAENAKSHPDAYKTCRFSNILDFLGVTEMGPRDRSLGPGLKNSFRKISKKIPLEKFSNYSFGSQNR